MKSFLFYSSLTLSYMLAGCADGANDFNEIQLTHDAFGHCLNSTQCFSGDGSKIVYDTRNNDAHLASNSEVRMIDIVTGLDTLLYRTSNQSEFGPGVGAATFSPDGKMVLFLGGIQNANRDKPYSFTRRTGIGVAIDQPLKPLWMDARNIDSPFTPGALRGGTHAHSWSGDGQMISFTYNDYVLSEAAKTNASILDTRTVGIMFPQPVVVPHADGVENKNGRCTSLLISAVVKEPKPGSDEIDRAFDECWIGSSGYKKDNGTWQERAIAFQGHVRTEDGRTTTAIFVVDIPANIPGGATLPSPGTGTALPAVPAGVQQRRITFDQTISATPRHWLRSTPDGARIGYLGPDNNGVVQLWTISPNGGASNQVTYLKSSVQGPFNFSPDGSRVAYISDDVVCVTDLVDGKTTAVTGRDERYGPPVGAVNWSPSGKQVCYNRYVKNDAGTYLQIFLATVK